MTRRSNVYNAFSEERIARAALEFTDELPQRGTRLYFLGDLEEIADAGTRFEL